MGSCSPRIFVTVILALVGLGLTACLDRQLGSNDSKTVNYRIYTNSEIGYSFSVLNDFAHETDDEEGMYFGYSEKSKFGNIYVQSHDHLASEHCNDSLMGASELHKISVKNKTTIWGKVDFFDKRGWDYLPEDAPLCRPMGGKDGAGYVLCSEKNEKIVMICISQVVDNPQLAKEIFETFRWIK